MGQIVAIPQKLEGSFWDEDGNELISQKGQDVTYVEVKNVPSMGAKTISLKEGRKDLLKTDMPFRM